MNLFDIFILIVLAFFALKGLLRGLVNEASSLVGLVLGVWIAYRYYPIISVPIKKSLHIPEHFAAFLAFMMLLALAGVLAHLFGNFVTKALSLVMLGGLNRIGGILFGVAEGVLLLSVFFSICTADFMSQQFSEKIRSSVAADMFAHMGDGILSMWREGASKRP